MLLFMLVGIRAFYLCFDRYLVVYYCLGLACLILHLAMMMYLLPNNCSVEDDNHLCTSSFICWYGFQYSPSHSAHGMQ